MAGVYQGVWYLRNVFLPFTTFYFLKTHPENIGRGHNLACSERSLFNYGRPSVWCWAFLLTVCSMISDLLSFQSPFLPFVLFFFVSVGSLWLCCYTWRPQPECKCAYARYSIGFEGISEFPDPSNWRELLNIFTIAVALHCIFSTFVQLTPFAILCSCSAKSAGPSSLPTIPHSLQHVVCCSPLIPLLVQPHVFFSVFFFQHALSEQDPKSASNTDLDDMPLKRLRRRLMNLSLSKSINSSSQQQTSEASRACMWEEWLLLSLNQPWPPSLIRSRVMSDLLSTFCSCAAVLHVCFSPLVDDFLWDVFSCSAETERQGTDHLDLAGLPQRSTNSDSTNTLSTTPDGKKKNKGIKKLFGKWVLTWKDGVLFEIEIHLEKNLSYFSFRHLFK